MIKECLVDVKVSSRNINFIKRIGLNPIIGYIIKIKTSELWENSHVIITACCDICNSERKMTFQEYYKYEMKSSQYNCKSCFNKYVMPIKMINKFGVDSYTKTEEYKIKSKDSNFKKFGVDNYTKTEEYKIKSKESNLLKYGVEFSSQSKEMRDKYDITISMRSIKKTLDINNKRKITRINNNLQIPDEQLTDFKKYKIICNFYTNRNKKNMLKNWNGLDYYDGEYIKDNFSFVCTNRLYPTIDHKISLYYGFITNIIPQIIGDINNLCITKRCINSSKGKKNDFDYIS